MQVWNVVDFRALRFKLHFFLPHQSEEACTIPPFLLAHLLRASFKAHCGRCCCNIPPFLPVTYTTSAQILRSPPFCMAMKESKSRPSTRSQTLRGIKAAGDDSWGVVLRHTKQLVTTQGHHTRTYTQNPLVSDPCRGHACAGAGRNAARGRHAGLLFAQGPNLGHNSGAGGSRLFPLLQHGRLAGHRALPGWRRCGAGVPVHAAGQRRLSARQQRLLKPGAHMACLSQ